MKRWSGRGDLPGGVRRRGDFLLCREPDKFPEERPDLSQHGSFLGCGHPRRLDREGAGTAANPPEGSRGFVRLKEPGQNTQSNGVGVFSDRRRAGLVGEVACAPLTPVLGEAAAARPRGKGDFVGPGDPGRRHGPEKIDLFGVEALGPGGPVDPLVEARLGEGAGDAEMRSHVVSECADRPEEGRLHGDRFVRPDLPEDVVGDENEEDVFARRARVVQPRSEGPEIRFAVRPVAVVGRRFLRERDLRRVVGEVDVSFVVVVLVNGPLGGGGGRGEEEEVEGDKEKRKG